MRIQTGILVVVLTLSTSFARAQFFSWVQWFQSSGSTIWSIACDDEENLYVAGTCSGTLTIGDQSLRCKRSDAFMAKLSPEGRTIWLKRLRTTGRVDLSQVVNTNGIVVVSGKVDRMAALSGRLIRPGDFTARMDGDTISLVRSVRKFATVPATDSLGWPPSEPYHKHWQQRKATITEGLFVACGYGIIGLNDCLAVTKFDPLGTPSWEYISGGGFKTYSHGDALTIAPNGDVIVVGLYAEYDSYAQGEKGGAMLYARLDADGRLKNRTEVFPLPVSSRGVPIWPGNSGTAVCVNNRGTVFVAGILTGRQQFGTNVITRFDSNPFVARIAPGW